VVFAAQASSFGVAVTVLIVGADSLTVTEAEAVTGAGGCGAGGCTQQRTGNFFGRSIGGGGGVVSVTVNCTLKLPTLLVVNVRSGPVLSCA
jgi:hypothetical protein